MIVSPRLTKAYEYAAKMHCGQVRKKSGKPYITHPLRVAKLVWTTEGSQDLILAAILHDVPEDCCKTLTDRYHKLEGIASAFGENVSILVEELTNVYTKYFYPDMNRQERKRLELKRICGISQDAKLIKCADRIDNLLDFKINGGMPEYYRKESAELYYDALEQQTGSTYLETILESLLK